MCVVPQDVHSFGVGDVLKVLAVDLHDLEHNIDGQLEISNII